MTEDGTTDDSGAKTDRLAWVAWGVLVAGAGALYELFHQPALLGATISLKFAWGDARTGYWLRARDPDRRRGSANFWVYLGYGLWKSAICGFVLSFVFVGLDAALHGKAANRPPGQKNETLILLFAGSCVGGLLSAWLSGAVSCVGFALALRAGAKVWLNSRVAACRVRDLWPPDGGDRNELAFVALPSSLMCGSLLTGILGLGIAALLAGNNNRQLQWIGMAATFAALIFLPVLALLLNDWVKKRLKAASPVEAWPDAEPGS